MTIIEHQDSYEQVGIWEGGNGSVRDFFELLKPRVMSLVIFTAFVGMMLAPGNIHPVIGVVGILFIAVGAGASGALNMWYDADIDNLMSRTQKRPIPAGKISQSEALVFGTILAVASVFLLGVFTNWVAAILLAFTIFFYVVIYTMWLKRSTPQNIVIGGAAGAFPPMIGWALSTGTVSIESIALFLIIFVWTPPHFWSLALLKSDDYTNAKVPMMPVVLGKNTTRRQILTYSLLLFPVGISPFLLGFAGIFYLVISILLGSAFVYFAFKVWRNHSEHIAKLNNIRLFSYSIFYLFAIFTTLLLDKLVVF